MDIVLGVSMTPTTVRMVLVEGEKADGSIVDHDAFDITANDGSATSSSAAEQVVEAVLGTKESATAGGHHLKSIGVTWSDHAEASTLRDALAARGIDDVMLVSDGHAAARTGPGRRPGRRIRHHRAVVHRSGHRDAVGGADRRRLRREGAEPLPAQRRRDGRPHRDGRGRRCPGLAAAGHVRRRLRRRRQLGEGAPGEPRQPARQRARRTRTRAGPWRGAGIGQRACLRGDHRRPGLLAGSRRDHGGHRRMRALAAADTQLAPVSGEPVDDYAAQTDIGADCCRGGSQAVPARRQRADVDLRGWRCGTGHFAGREHPADGRSAAEPRPERDRARAPRRPRPRPVQEAQQPVAPAPPPHRRRPSSRRCPSPCRKAPAPSRRRGRCSSSRRPPRRRPRPPRHRRRHRRHPRHRRPHRFPWRQRRCPYIPAPVYNPPVYNPYLPPPGVLPAAQAVVTSVAPPWHPAAAGASRTAGATAEPAVAGIRRRLGFGLRDDYPGSGSVDTQDRVDLAARRR